MNFINRTHSQDSLSLYNINPETGTFVIEVSLDDYSELFNGWDASPVRKKEIEPELMGYFEQAAVEIPLKEKIEIRFYVPAERRDSDKEATSRAALLNNFRVQHLFAEQKLSDIYRRFVTYIIVSAMLLTAAYIFPETWELPLFFQIMIHGLVIGGWWILWEGFSLFFFTGHEVRTRKRYFQRYLKSHVCFQDISLHPDKMNPS